MYTVHDFYKQLGKRLEIKLCAGNEGLSRKISVPEAHRAGLALSGHLKYFAKKRIVILGKAESEYLKGENSLNRRKILEPILTPELPAVILARRLLPPKELFDLCEERKIPLFRSPLPTMRLIGSLAHFLADEFAPSLTYHGSLVEVYGVGVLIQGDSSVGKSEAALGLLERGHHLVSDDVVKVKRREGYLEGFGIEISRHHMEIRGIGIINVANLYGAVCVREKKSLDIVVKLEVWDDVHPYDRLGVEDKMINLLDVEIPFHLLPVKPGRDVVLLLETIALNHRLKKMGYHSAKEFEANLLKAMERKS
ncbi:MAG: HPr kinase/phosphorylase [Chlamydiae bacterium]|nr:HPr kinase/phosphorylase [Chlamydiota bacterium]